MSQEGQTARTGFISFRPDLATLGKIERISRRMGVSKNAVVSILTAGALARGDHLASDEQRVAAAMLAAALAALHGEEKP